MSGKSVQNKLPDLVNIAKEFAVALRGMPKDDHALLQNLMLALAMKMLSRTQMGCYFEDDEKIGRFHRQYDSMNEAMLEILNGAKAADTTWARDIADMQQTIREALAAYKADQASGDYQVWSLTLPYFADFSLTMSLILYSSGKKRMRRGT